MKSLLPGVLGKVALESGRAAGLRPIWDEVAGPVIARQTRPVVLSEGVLLVSVSGAEWAKRLEPLAAELCTKLGERLGSRDVHTLRFRVR